MPISSGLDAVGRAKYVRLTTFKKDGTAVPTPVRVVTDGEALLVTTRSGTGKIKRLAHTSRVLLAPSDQRGRVADGVVDTKGEAAVTTDRAVLERLGGLLKAKYGFLYSVISLLGRLGSRSGGVSVAIRITDPAAG